MFTGNLAVEGVDKFTGKVAVEADGLTLREIGFAFFVESGRLTCVEFA